MSGKPWSARLTSKEFRTVGLLALPGAYVLGFLLWSYYAVRQGLGFLPLTSPRYLTAGVTLAAYGLLALWLPIRVLSKSHRRKKGRTVALVLLVTVGNLFALMLFQGLSSSLHIFTINGPQGWVMAAAPLATVLLVLAAQALGFAIGILSQAVDWIWESILRHKAQTFKKPEIWPFFSLYKVGWACTLFLLAAHLLLPSMEPEFGGAMPRHARIDLVTSGLSSEAMDRFDIVGNTTVASVNVTVLFYDSASMLVRIPPHDTAQDPLYELDRNWISAIVWLD